MASLGVGDFSQLVHALYGAAMEPSEWQGFLRSLVEALRAKSAMIRVVDLGEEKIAFHADYNLDPALRGLYAEHFVHVDPCLAGLKRLPPDRMYRAHDVITERDFTRTEYFSDYLAPQDSYYLAGGFVAKEARRTIYFGVQRSRRQGQFGDSEIETLQLLVPHLRRSVDLHRLVVQHQLRELASDRVLENLAIGVALLDGMGRVLYANRRMREFETKGHGVRILNDRLFANSPSDGSRLQRLIAEISAAARVVPETPQVESIMLGEGYGEGELFLLASTLVPALPFFGLYIPYGAIVVLVGEATQVRTLDHRILKSLYGLTRAESRIAADLAKGANLHRICARFNLSCNTARSQLRSVFRKTGTSSQPELVSRLLAGPFFVPGGDGLPVSGEQRAH